LAWAIALAVAALALGWVERRWRERGYQPNVLDSAQLWSLQRQRVHGDSPRPLVLLGASRIQAAIDPPLLRELLPDRRPIMLAVSGRYPLAALRDLAADEDFHGDVICDIESNGFLREYRDLQQDYVDYFHRQWTPSWHLHRALLTEWQQAALIADPRFGIIETLRHALQGGKPYHDYVRLRPDRATEIDYALTDPEGAKRHFAATVEGNIAHLPRRTPDEWLADIAPVFVWARAIQARGGRVIFYESPLHGLQREVQERVYPRDAYWHRFAATSPAPVLSARDVPALMAFDLPDDSHLDRRDKAAFTHAFVQALHERGLLTSAPP